MTSTTCRRRLYNQAMRYILLTALLSVLLLQVSCDLLQASNIEKAVVKALHDDSRTGEFDFEVSYEGEGKVLVTGEVDNEGQIEAAKEVAGGVEGVTSVSVNISIADNSSSGLMQDGALNSPFF
ncbi:MAG: BON domain-containing protein [Planctomycetales bacterium]|nr:BON domain-containing protein [bacterium]UNM07424.1 MAG: BON domain-containing protein [Planctomycetales bacterium]